MVSQRVLGGTLSVVLCGMLVSTAEAAGSKIDLMAADTASAPRPELTVAPPTDYPDVRLTSGYAFSGQVAFDPADPKRLVVGIGLPGASRCSLRASPDGGKHGPGCNCRSRKPGAESRHYCSGSAPAVTYAAGHRLYAAYAWSDYDAYTTGVVVSASTDQGATWSTPTAALPEYESDTGEYYDIHLAAAPDGPGVYVAAIFPGHLGSALDFGRSSDQGSNWTSNAIAVAETNFDGTFFGEVDLAAGRDGSVLVAYEQEEYIPQTGRYKYLERVARSADHGVSFLYGTVDQFSSVTASLWAPVGRQASCM